MVQSLDWTKKIPDNNASDTACLFQNNSNKQNYEECRIPTTYYNHCSFYTKIINIESYVSKLLNHLSWKL